MMEPRGQGLVMLMADDDEEDRMMALDAVHEGAGGIEIRFVEDGEQLLDYLRGSGQYAGSPPPAPGLILLDLNMPRKDGREALREIRADPDLRAIPVVVLTTSKAEEDILRTYSLGANSFISKPVTFDGLVRVMRTLGLYWFDTVRLPAQRPQG